MDDFKRSHIPAFGNWDYEDGGLPITQYFESARQAGLLRYSYGEAGGGGDLYSYSSYGGFEENDLYLKPTIAVVPRRKKQQTKGSSEWEYQQQQKKQARVHDMTLTASRSLQQHVRQAPKAVDEDLYKIPPELLYTTTTTTTNSHNKKRRTFGFFSRCLMPLCTTV